ncbi:MAG TPA: helix-turn-helix domain-containing protein [Acidimicrobiia bacterium]|nr:helix-turn-helix domain-containing protein [Acidimicrobiia bacterium]
MNVPSTLSEHPARGGPDDVFWLTSADHFDLLSDRTRLEIIENLFSPAAVAEIAARMGTPRTRLYHHIKLLEEAGMIRVVATRRSGAQTEKLYQVAAFNFQPSPQFMRSALPRKKAQAVVRSIFASTEADFVRAVDTGAALLEDDRQARQTHLGRRLLVLNREKLHEMITELENLLDRYDPEPEQLTGAPGEGEEVIGVLTMVYPSSRQRS